MRKRLGTKKLASKQAGYNRIRSPCAMQLYIRGKQCNEDGLDPPEVKRVQCESKRMQSDERTLAFFKTPLS